MGKKYKLNLRMIEMETSNDITIKEDVSTNLIAENNKDTKNIKHIVCSGGGIAGFQYLGILEEAYKQKLWHIENIKSYYGTSVGTIIGVCILLKYDWDEITKYFTQRPFDKLFPLGLKSVLQSISRLGLYNIDTIRTLLSPFLLASKLTIDITMQEFYNATNIEFHCITTNVTKYTCEDISYKTHPTWKLIDAVYCSCAIPIIFEPLEVNGYFYADGYLLSNYPLYQCIQNGAVHNEILGITPGYIKKELSLSSNDTMIEYLSLLIHQMTKSTHEAHTDIIGYQFEVYTDNNSPNKVRECMLNEQYKLSMINEGKAIVLDYTQTSS